MPSRQDDASHSETWARVYDELRSQQSLASVINDPYRGNRLLRGQWDGLGEFVDTVRESVEELNEQREVEGIDPATIARIDALVGQVPDVTDFQSYLDTFADVWETYHRNHRRSKSKSRSAGNVDVSGKSRVELDAIEEDDASAREAHFGVPPEYFSSSFSLEQQQMFRLSLEVVVERQEDLHGELSGYLDLVEVSLFEHIRKAQQDHLFDSLASLGEPLQQDLFGAADVIRTLRKHLKQVQKRQLECGLAVGRLARRKRRVQEVLHRLDCLEHVRQCRPSIQMLLQGRDFITALDLIDSTTSALDSNLKGVVSVQSIWTQLVNLGETFDRAVEAEFVHQSSEALLRHDGPISENGQEATEVNLRLRHLCQCLVTRGRLRAALNPTLRDVLLSHMKKAIRQHAKALLQELGEPKESNGDHGDHGDQGEQDKADTKVETVTAVDPDQSGASPKEAFSPDCSEAGQIAETEAPSTRIADGQSGAAFGISSALCALSFESFFEFWKKLLEFVAQMATRFTDYALQVHHVVTDTQHAVRAGEESQEVAAELQRLLEVTLAQAFKIVGALLQARHEEHKRLKIPEWHSFLHSTNEMLKQVHDVQKDCQSKMDLAEHVGIETQAGLLAISYSQTKSIIEEFHQKCLLQTKQMLEQERWERTDVPVQYKIILDKLLGHEVEVQQNEEGRDDGAAPVERYLHVEGSHYLVVPAVLTLLQLLAEYINLCRDFSDMTPEVVQRMCQLLRLFNQKAHNLVLNGQAVQHKVLPNIKAANLAMSSQCCGLMAQVLPLLQTRLNTAGESPHVQNALAAAKGALVAALLSDLSKIASEFAEHRTALFGKLSDLLRVHYEKHSQRWLKVPHSEGPDIWKGDAMAALRSESSLGEHESLEGLVKDITAMYRVLLRHLNYDSVRKIFARAFEEIASSFQQRLEQDIPAPSPPYSDSLGRSLGDRLLLDFAFLYRELEKLTGITTPLQRLLCDLVQHLQTKLPEDPPKKTHPVVLEALQRAGRLPQ